MTRNDFWNGFGWGLVAGAGIGIGLYTAASAEATSSGARRAERKLAHSHKDRQFSMSVPLEHLHGRRDLLEADGALLENIRGGEQKVDRRKIESDKGAVYSPSTPTNFSENSSQPAPGKRSVS